MKSPITYNTQVRWSCFHNKKLDIFDLSFFKLSFPRPTSVFETNLETVTTFFFTGQLLTYNVGMQNTGFLKTHSHHFPRFKLLKLSGPDSSLNEVAIYNLLVYCTPVRRTSNLNQNGRWIQERVYRPRTECVPRTVQGPESDTTVPAIVPDWPVSVWSAV